MEGYTESLATYLEASFNIKVTVVEPGGIKTEFVNNVMGNLASTGGIAQDEYYPILMSYMAKVKERGTTTYQTSDEVAEVIVKVVESESPPIRVRTSEWAEAFCSLKTGADPDGTLQRNDVRSKMFAT